MKDAKRWDGLGGAVRWELAPFADLGVRSLYDVIVLRQIVFAVEQACVFLDADGKDLSSLHLLGREPSGRLAVYARLLPPGVGYAEASIGRVVSHPEVRRTGMGRELMHEAIRHTREAYGIGPIRIGAQMYLVRFYGSFGFTVVSAPYLEDGIEHVEMLLP